MSETKRSRQGKHIDPSRNTDLVTSSPPSSSLRRVEQELRQAKEALASRSAELAASRSLLNTTLESTADGIIVLDLAGKVVLYNTRFAAIWQLPVELLKRRDYMEIMTCAARQIKNSDKFLQRLQELQKQPEIESCDVIELKDGRSFERYRFPQQVAEQCVGVVVNWREVTQRRQSEAALRLSEEKYRLLWTTAGDAFVLCDADSTILEANSAVFDVFGYRPEELIGHSIAMLQPEQFQETHRREIQRYLVTGTQEANWRSMEAIGLHRDGHEIPLEIAFNHLHLEGKHLFAGFIRDITDRKQAEAEREVLLKREQAARAEAEVANRAKDEFLATLSHELRSPLTAILGWSDLVGDNRLGEEEKRQAIEAIKRNASLQARLIEDILDVSRIISGKLRLEVNPTELSSVIRAAIESVLPSARAKEIRLQRVLDTSSCVVSGDSARLQQIVWNLLSNAIKFTPKGGRVQIRLERVSSHVEIMVTDTGEGIKPEVLPYIFDRFRQADSTSTRSYGGLGLGLAIVRHLVEMHGGTVQAHSEGDGNGATFIVKFPLIAACSTQIEHENIERRRCLITARSNDIQSQDLPELSGLHVLVVDDDEDARILVKTLLEKRGAQITFVSSAKEALAALQETWPDVLVSDLGMPDEDGYSLIRKVRALPPECGGETPAVALTAYARLEDRMKVLQSGFQIHLSKPVEPAELITVVANLAGRFRL